MTKHTTTYLHLVLCFGALLWGRSVWAQADGWISSGPEGGGISALAVDPSNPSILYAGTFLGSLFKSIDGGVSWEESDTGLAEYWIPALAVAPSSPQHILAGTVGGIYRSVNGGADWSHVRSGTSNIIRSLAFQNDTIAYAGGQGGVYRTLDRGETWTLVASVSRDVFFVVVDPASGAVYAVAEEGVLRSTNGVEWGLANNGLEGRVDQISLDAQNPTTLYVRTPEGLFRTTDAGDSWAPLASDIPSAWIHVSPVDSELLFAGVSSIPARIFRSTDGGDTWSPLSAFPPDVSINRLVPDPVDTAIVHVATSQGLWQSRDQGATWSHGVRGFVATWVRAIAVHPSTPSTLYAGTGNNGLWKSVDSGLSWEAKDAGHEAHQSVFDLVIDPLAPDTIYAATLRGVLKSTDGGDLWQSFNNALASTFVGSLEIDPRDPDVLYAATDRDGMWKSMDGGVTWQAINEGLSNLVMESVTVDPAEPSTVYAGTNTGGLFRSRDGGRLWQQLSSLPITFVNVLTIDPTDSRVLYAGSAVGTGGLYKSRDGGASWGLVGGGLPTRDMRGLLVDRTDGRRLYAATFGRGVYRSDDGGDHWTPLPEVGGRAILTLARAEGVLPVLYAGTLGRGALSLKEEPSCRAGATTLCLQEGRFRIEVTWRNSQGQTGAGQATALSAKSGHFWFFEHANLEVLVKVLDGRPINGHYWLFLASLTNVSYDLVAIDYESGVVKTYRNLDGSFTSLGDTTAFPATSSIFLQSPK